MTKKKYSEEEIKQLKDQTDYDRLKKMTDQLIKKNSETDEDSLTPSDDDLEKFKKVKKDEK